MAVRGRTAVDSGPPETGVSVAPSRWPRLLVLVALVPALAAPAAAHAPQSVRRAGIAPAVAPVGPAPGAAGGPYWSLAAAGSRLLGSANRISGGPARPVLRPLPSRRVKRQIRVARSARPVSGRDAAVAGPRSAYEAAPLRPYTLAPPA
jgi:hypothetical protein